jgi:hypothetical protein
LAYSFDNANPFQVDRILIENNYFGRVPHPGHGITLGNDGSAACGSNNLNNIIQNNTFYGNVMADVRCSGSVDAIFRNNIVTGNESCVGDGGNHQYSWDYNVFPSSGAGGSCGSTTRAKLCKPTFVDASYANGMADLVAADTCAKDMVFSGAGTYPLTDRRGTPRPSGAAVDAGAFEIGSGAPSPPGSLRTTAVN